MGLLFKNNAETTLSSGINDSVTTVPVTSAAVFPTPTANDVFFATIDDGTNIEVVKVTAISSNDLTVVRAQDNTSASAFSSGANIELRLTAKILEMGTSSLTDLDGDTVIVVEEAADEDKIKFKAAGTEVMRIDSTGIGIGGVNATEKITVDGNIANSSGDMTIDVAGDIILDADGGTIVLKDGGTEKSLISLDNAGYFDIYSSIQDSDIRLRGNDGGSLIDALILDMSDAGRALFNGSIDIGGSNITRTGDLTIDVTGDILLDADGENIKFLDGGVERGQIDLGSANFTLRASTSDKDMIFRVNDGGSEIVALTIDASEAGAATFNDNVTAYSDERLKDNIETIENGLDKVEQLRGVTYTRDEKESIGVIAQEVEKILPEIVLTADDEMGTKSVDYGRLTAVLIEAVKDLSARVKELEGK